VREAKKSTPRVGKSTKDSSGVWEGGDTGVKRNVISGRKRRGRGGRRAGKL